MEKRPSERIKTLAYRCWLDGHKPELQDWIKAILDYLDNDYLDRKQKEEMECQGE